MVRAARVVTACVALAVAGAAACGGSQEDEASSASALAARHVLVVGDETSNVREPARGDDGDPSAAPDEDGGASSAANDAGADDDADPEELAPAARGGGALLRPVRRLDIRATCKLAPGRYALDQAPRKSVDGLFWHVSFEKAPEGTSGEPCGRSGWLELGGVRFETQALTEPSPVEAPGVGAASAQGCELRRGFVPRWVKPVSGPVTGRFGDCRDGCSRRHAGIDIAAASGTSLVAAEEGKIVDVGTGRGACGTVVMVRHPNGAETRFCHNRRVVVKKGECVARGQKIAEVGNTGIGTGPHMHMEYYPSATGGAADPRRVFGY